MLNISDRTFGLELEFGNIHKPSVKLPDGYKFSQDERSIVNSTRTRSTPNGDYGAEINTRPLNITRKDIRELRRFIKNCQTLWGGVLMWNTGFDGHIYIGDLGLEELKKIFALGYHTTALIKNIFHLGAWFDVDILVPTPSIEIYNRVKNCKTIEDLKNAFANSSNRGHWRFAVNIMPYFKTKTLEFRIFNSTSNFREVLESIRFMYVFLEYAVTHEEKDFIAIKTEEDFRKTFGITHDFAKAVAPLIFAEDVMVFTSNIAKGFAPTSRLVSAFAKNENKKIALVNPFEYSSELQLVGLKDITIVNNEEYENAIYRIAKGQEIKYLDDFSFLNEYKNGTAERELELFFIFARLQRYNKLTEYGQKEFCSFIKKIPESITKLSQRAKNLVELFEKSKYIIGNIYDALRESDFVVYQQVGYGKHNSVMKSLKKYSDWKVEWNSLQCDYKNVLPVEEEKELLVVSKNAFLPMHKIAKDGSTYLYSNKKKLSGCHIEIKKENSFDIKIPNDDYEITENTVLTIKETNQKLFSYLQSRFVKKVQKTTPPNIGYVLCDGDIILGAFGFNYSKKSEYSLWLLSDFCTNNNIPKMSKLMLYAIRSKEVKSALERKLSNRIKNCYTKVYTSMPTSMKYRGAFRKVGRDNASLVYDFDFGDIESLGTAIKEYLKKRGEQ